MSYRTMIKRVLIADAVAGLLIVAMAIAFNLSAEAALMIGTVLGAIATTVAMWPFE